MVYRSGATKEAPKRPRIALLCMVARCNSVISQPRQAHKKRDVGRSHLNHVSRLFLSRLMEWVWSSPMSVPQFVPYYSGPLEDRRVEWREKAVVFADLDQPCTRIVVRVV